jgi:TetR/AcrR family transcriptional regulator, transcriptional repressor for nem operon
VKQRKKQPVQTRAAILKAAGAEFSLNGYAGSGLISIVQRAGLTKGALFHHFPDKRALAAAWITEELSAAMQDLWIKPLADINSLDSLRALCRARCLDLRPGDATSTLVAMAAETAAVDKVLAAAQESVFSAWRTAIAGLIENGKSASWIHRSIQPATEAAFFVSLFAGFTVTSKCSPDEAARRNCAAALEAYLETLRAQ